MLKFETPQRILNQNLIAIIVTATAPFLITEIASAKSLSDCEGSFETISYDSSNWRLHYRYKQIESEYDPDLDSSFASHRASFLKAMKNKSHWHWGARQFNQDAFSKRVTERMHLLWNREPSPDAKLEIGRKLQEIDHNQQLLSDWRDLSSTQNNSRVLRLLSDAAPKKDGQNVKKNEDLENWNQAMQLATRLAHNKRDLTKEDLAHLAVVLQGYAQHSSASTQFPHTYLAKFLTYDDLNFMYTKTPSGRRKLDPLNTFISGSDKQEALAHFIGWLRKSRNTTHPVIAAAQARQYIVSVHPLWDANGRLARIVANYVLMRAGYPPAHIPRGTETENVSVALFPLRDFQDQISPEESIQIMLEGVLRAQRALLE